jgi:dihydroneopterin aldolase
LASAQLLNLGIGLSQSAFHITALSIVGTGMDVGVNTVFLKGMLFSLQLGKDAWKREGKTQPVRIDVSVGNINSIADAAASDDVSKCLDYGDLYKKIKSNLDDRQSYLDALEVARQALKFNSPRNSLLNVDITLCKAALDAEGGFRYSFGRDGNREDLVYFKSLQILSIRCRCIIGVNPHERRMKQPVLISLIFRAPTETMPESSDAWTTMRQGSGIVDTVIEVWQLLNPFLPLENHSFHPSACQSLLKKGERKGNE